MQTIIHIGLHKTGTSFLQTQYFPEVTNATYLNGNIYQTFGRKSLHENILISYEGLSGYPWNSEWLNGINNSHKWIESFKIAVNNLKKIHPEAIIVFSVRKHGDLLISLYKQYIHEGGILKINDFYGNNKIVGDADLNLKNRILYLEENFENVVIFSYESFRKDGLRYVSEFFGALGLDPVLKTEKNRVNKSVEGKKLEYLRRMNYYYKNFPPRIKYFLRIVQLRPRDIFQKRLNWWTTPDEEDFNVLKEKINHEFKKDWQYVQSKCLRNSIEY